MSNYESEDEVLLRAKGEVTLHGRSYADDELFKASEDEAVELVFASRASVASGSQNPPQKVLEELVRGALQLDRVGPVSLDESVLAKFEDKALRSGTRHTIVEGQALEWIKGRAAAERMFLALQTKLNLQLFSSILTSLKVCMKTKQESSKTVRFHKKIPVKDADAQGLVYIQKSSGRPMSELYSEEPHSGKETYLKLSPEWRRFYSELSAFEARLSRSFFDCLETGRILCVEDTAAGATLFAPFLWERSPPRFKKAKELNFVMAKDLPAGWYKQRVVLKGKEREHFVAKLVGILEANYRRHWKNGLKLRKSTFVERAVDALGCSETLATFAWKEADIPHWKVQGRIRDEQLLNEVEFFPR